MKTSVAPTAQVSYPNFLSTGIQEEINGIGFGLAVNVTALFSPFENYKPFYCGIKGGFNLTTIIDWQTINNHNVSDVPETELLGTNLSLLVGFKF